MTGKFSPVVYVQPVPQVSDSQLLFALWHLKWIISRIGRQCRELFTIIFIKPRPWVKYFSFTLLQLWVFFTCDWPLLPTLMLHRLFYILSLLTRMNCFLLECFFSCHGWSACLIFLLSLASNQPCFIQMICSLNSIS